MKVVKLTNRSRCGILCLFRHLFIPAVTLVMNKNRTKRNPSLLVENIDGTVCFCVRLCVLWLFPHSYRCLSWSPVDGPACVRVHAMILACKNWSGSNHWSTRDRKLNKMSHEYKCEPFMFNLKREARYIWNVPSIFKKTRGNFFE